MSKDKAEEFKTKLKALMEEYDVIIYGRETGIDEINIFLDDVYVNVCIQVEIVSSDL